MNESCDPSRRIGSKLGGKPFFFLICVQISGVLHTQAPKLGGKLLISNFLISFLPVLSQDCKKYLPL